MVQSFVSFFPHST